MGTVIWGWGLFSGLGDGFGGLVWAARTDIGVAGDRVLLAAAAARARRARQRSGAGARAAAAAAR